MFFPRQVKGISFCRQLITISCRNYNNSLTTKITANTFPAVLINNPDINKLSTRINKEIGIQQPAWKKIIEKPLTNKVVEIPNNQSIANKIIDDFLQINHTVDLPTNPSSNNIKQAARLIVIRKRKMRKHKLRKLRKKMKFVWAKAKQRREWKKEKRFLNGLLSEIKAAQKFSAEDYVNEMMRKATENPPPKYYKSRRMPTWLILDILEKEKQKKIERKYKFWEECGK